MSNPAIEISAPRFQFLKWPLTFFEKSVEFRKQSFPLPKKAKKTKYPIRMLRYWWVLSAINDELKRLASPIIADVGCGKGIFKRLLPRIEGSHVIGMDLRPQLDKYSGHLKLADYDEMKVCNLDVEVPLPDSSVDVLVNLHVMEHLPRPEYTITEFARVLKPGGLLLLGFPVVPRIFAWIRERQFAKQFENGTRSPGQHRHAFWPRRARKLVENADLKVEFLLGTYFVRKCGAFWENSALWMRFNQFWGTIIPCMGQELCMKVRKPS